MSSSNPAVAGDDIVSKEERYALKQVQKLKGFYIHLSIYLIGIAGLLVINLLTSPNYFWVVWPALGWGVGVLSHAARVFGGGNLLFGPAWERKQVEKRLGRKL